jgi:hypothetical protein
LNPSIRIQRAPDSTPASGLSMPRSPDRFCFRLYVRCSGSNASTLDIRWDFAGGAAGTPGLVDRHSDRSASDGIL